MRFKFVIIIAALLFILLFAFFDSTSERLSRARKVQDSDNIKIYLLQGIDSEFAKTHFRVDSRTMKYNVYGITELRGIAKTSFIEAWRGLTFPSGKPLIMCHYPIYGVEISRAGKVKFRTTISWECENLLVATKFYGAEHVQFDAIDNHSKQMLSTLDKVLPYSRTFRDDEMKRIQNFMEN